WVCKDDKRWVLHSSRYPSRCIPKQRRESSVPVSKRCRLSVTHNFGGGSFMVWSDFSARNRLEIVFVSGRMDSVEYYDTLHRHLLPFLRD
ncbi:hypothetical protein ANCDUO_25378, partial [Ancylostoma duodenale]